MTKKDTLPLIPPGKILLEEFIEPLGLTRAAVSRAAGIPGSRLTEIIKGNRIITADTALRLGRYFRTTPNFWMNLQSAHEIEKAERESGMRIQREVKELEPAGA